MFKLAGLPDAHACQAAKNLVHNQSEQFSGGQLQAAAAEFCPNPLSMQSTHAKLPPPPPPPGGSPWRLKSFTAPSRIDVSKLLSESMPFYVLSAFASKLLLSLLPLHQQHCS